MKQGIQFKDIFQQLLWIVGLIAARSSLAGVYVVPTGSMEPTILPGDHLWVNHAAYDLKIPLVSQPPLWRISEPARGEVIVFQDPKRPEIYLVKRLIGLPGDHVKVSDGWIEINGKWIEHKNSDPIRYRQREKFAQIESEKLGDHPHLVQLAESTLRSGSDPMDAGCLVIKA